MSGAIWDRLIGHEAIVKRLVGEVVRGRGAQAYLFAGADQLGKTTCALGLAQRLNCAAAEPPCGVCPGCRAVALAVPTHVRVLVPEEQGGSGPYRSRLHKIDTLRELQRELALRAFGEQIRVAIIQTAEAMAEPVANSLLKTLEEPPPRVVLILTSEQPTGLLPTILSRVRRVDFAPVPTPAIAAWLRAEHGVAAAEAEVLAGCAAGRPGRALALARDPVARATRALTLELTAELGQRPPAAALVAAERLLAGEEEGGERRIELALDLLEWWYRDALLLRCGQPAERLVNRDQQPALERFAGRWTPAELRAGLTALHEARQGLRRNANARLMSEVLWLRLARGGRPVGQ